jgi:hypothetical protein
LGSDSFGFHSTSDSDTSSTGSSKASTSAKYALCLFTKSSGSLGVGVLEGGRFCLRHCKPVRKLDIIADRLKIKHFPQTVECYASFQIKHIFLKENNGSPCFYRKKAKNVGDQALFI